MVYAKELGLKAENHFISELNKLGIPYEFVDDWYDFEVNGKKVEIKSCRISVKHVRSKTKDKEDQYRTGRFDFTKEENREKQYNENIWVGFIVRHYDQFIILGFCKAKNLEKKRYISIHKTREIGLKPFEDWVKEINKC